MLLYSPSKLNLFFRVLRKREDGYHEVASLFQAIDFCDRLEIEFSAKDLITCTDPTLDCGPTNLVWKAREEFRKNFPLPPVHIHLHKKVPIQSGLGGGSGNAATVLWGLNALLNHPASEETLREIGARFGSDVSFFFSTGTAYCTGRGEKVNSLPPLPTQTGWLAKPHFGLSTPLVYKHTKVDSLSPRDPLHALLLAKNGTPEYFNDLEVSSFTLEPRLIDLKIRLLQSFQTVVMTGSGTAFFCLNGTPPREDVNFYPFSFLQRSPERWYCPA
ncbi:MAG: 4-(cytidine 5'-diphospho)-2-C-methyl-D-erythritol kinase [Verrucomicrobia bacterium]|nr:4-(cytidine 5'-diphospho)-2-C-methyl-D-erythritol kinase [Verrucomicrobiota bacterium]